VHNQSYKTKLAKYAALRERQLKIQKNKKNPKTHSSSDASSTDSSQKHKASSSEDESTMDERQEFQSNIT
jgi:hypothetical protein